MLHGGLFNIDLQFGELLPALAQTRQVIAADFQAHGRTGDIDRPLTSADLASDVVGLLKHLGVPKVDVFGFSVGGGVALHLAIKHPELLRQMIVSSVSVHPDGDRPENAEAVGEMTVDMIAGTRWSATTWPSRRTRAGCRICWTTWARSTRASPAGPTTRSRASARRR
ncbi:MAG: alpha/beta fold hydrolase [Nocardioidaceae bacterium]